MMLKAIVIDDEPLAHEVIKGFTEKVTFVNIAGYFIDSFAALAYIRETKVDLLFVDIEMPDLSGLELIKSIPDPPMVIFTTAYREHALEGFELNAIDYLLKPFSLTRFLKACNKAYENHKQAPGPGPSHLFLKSGYEQIRVELDKIIYAQSNGNYIVFVLADQKIISRLTMNEAEALLSTSAFIRVHRSYLVAKSYIRKIDKRNIRVLQTDIPIGTAYADIVEQLIK